MAGGVRYKFHGSTIKVLTGFIDSTSNPTITAITRANPAVVTASTHGLDDGDIIRIEDVGGMTEVNDGVFVVQNSDTNTFELADVDSRGYGVYTSGGEVLVGELSNFCELTNYNRQGGTSPEIPATSLCSTAQEFDVGLPDFGTTQIDYNFAPKTAVQQAVDTFYRSGDRMGVQVTLPNNGGLMVQLGSIQQTSEQAGVGGLWSASLTIRNSGPRVDLA